MKKYLSITLLFFLFYIFMLLYLNSNASYIQRGIDYFPNSYKPYLNILKQKHPNWNFIALYTTLDWDYVINNENIYGKNLVLKNYTDNWKNTKENEYNVEIDSGWVDSSRRAVEYCMDPRNFLNETRIFQFEELAYEENAHSIDGIEKILYGTELYNKNVDGSNKKYSELILNAGIISGVSPYHLASRIKQEVGGALSHPSISGTVEGFYGIYNFYNIGATSSEEPMGAIINGLNFALNGKNASQAMKNRYLIPWNTKEKAITGGAIFIGTSYINEGQNNIYLQKFDVNNAGNNGLFWHQYMTNILAPYSESKSIYVGYKNIGLLNTSMTFVIPIFNNMPDIMTDSPDIDLTSFIDVNDDVFCNALDVNIRTGPGTNFEIITSVSKNDLMTRIKKGNEWDKVILSNGIIGYIFNKYVSLNEFVQNENIGVALPLRLYDNTITGIPYNQNTLLNIKSKISSNYEIEFLGANDNKLKDNNLIGTGSKLKVIKSSNEIEEYIFVLYGDCNGDGKINSLDLLLLQRYILKLTNLDDIYKNSANISKNQNEPTSVDLLLIQQHILKTKIISQ